MEITPDIILPIVVAVLGCNGLWTLIQHVWDKRHTDKSAQSQMLRGLGHDRICSLGEQYIRRGYITKDEFESLCDYLYKPYRAMGGNGTAEKIMREIDKLPMREGET